MTTRNMEARLIKLEARRKRTNEVLLVWRRPDGDVAKALAGVEFAAGDRVICAEWFDDGPLPAPRWYQDRLTSALDAVGMSNLNRCLDRIRDDAPRDHAFAPVPFVRLHKMVELTDNDLLHFTIGVAT